MDAEERARMDNYENMRQEQRADEKVRELRHAYYAESLKQYFEDRHAIVAHYGRWAVVGVPCKEHPEYKDYSLGVDLTKDGRYCLAIRMYGFVMNYYDQPDLAQGILAYTHALPDVYGRKEN